MAAHVEAGIRMKSSNNQNNLVILASLLKKLKIKKNKPSDYVFLTNSGCATFF